MLGCRRCPVRTRTLRQDPNAATESSPSSLLPVSSGPDDPGSVTTPQLTAIWTVFRNVYKFGDDDKDHARAVAAHVIGRPLASTRDMSKNDGKALLDTLGNWQAIAKEREETPRDVLVAMMAAAEAESQEPPEAEASDAEH